MEMIAMYYAWEEDPPTVEVFDNGNGIIVQILTPYDYSSLFYLNETANFQKDAEKLVDSQNNDLSRIASIDIEHEAEVMADRFVDEMEEECGVSEPFPSSVREEIVDKLSVDIHSILYDYIEEYIDSHKTKFSDHTKWEMSNSNS